MHNEDCECKICKEGIKCRRCGTKMEGGKFKKEKDGTEWREIRCPKCGEKMMDVKAVWDFEKEAAAFEKENKDFPELGIFNREKCR